MTTPPRVWTWPLAASDVAGWLKLTGPDESELMLLGLCTAAACAQVERYRSDLFTTVTATTGGVSATTRVFAPGDEVLVAALMLAGRLYRRRKTPGGIESIADSVTYVTRYDPEIERALRVGAWSRPAVG